MPSFLVACQNDTTRLMAARMLEFLHHLGVPHVALYSCTRLMARALHLNLNTGTMRRAHSERIAEFAVTHKLEIVPKLRDSMMEIRKVPGATAV